MSAAVVDLVPVGFTVDVEHGEATRITVSTGATSRRFVVEPGASADRIGDGVAAAVVALRRQRLAGRTAEQVDAERLARRRYRTVSRAGRTRR